MASQPSRARKRDRIKAFFLHGTLHPESPATGLSVPSSSASSKEEERKPTAKQSPAGEPKKPFRKGQSFERDIAILSATYVIHESPELKKLIKLVILIRDKDEDGQLKDVLESFAHLSICLASASETYRSEVEEATKKIIEYVITTLRKDFLPKFLSAV